MNELRTSAQFSESAGEDVSLPLPGGVFSHYVSAPPGAAWALNLALLTPNSPFAHVPAPVGLVSRVLFRPDHEAEEISAELLASVTAALTRACDALEELHAELVRGRAVLARLSRNARARDAWLLVAALGTVTRMQLARALGLSRAGADIQAHALADAGLVRLRTSGRINWREQQPGLMLSCNDDQPGGALGGAIADLGREHGRNRQASRANVTLDVLAGDVGWKPEWPV